MRKLFISCPTRLNEIPLSWDHDLTLEMAVEEQYGYPVNCIDNAIFRFDIEVVANQAKNIGADKIIIYGGLRQYKFIKEYLRYFEGATVRGFPKGIIDDLPIENGAIPPEDPDSLPYPAWHLIPLDNYFINSPLPFTEDTAAISRRAIYKSRWGEKTRSIEKVADDLRYLKLVYNYDFIIFDEDFTYDIKRTYKLMDMLEEYNISKLFGWSCRANPEKVDRDFLTVIKENGCRIIDFGEIDVTDTRNPMKMLRLQSAIQTAKAWEIAPTFQCTIGYPETEKEDIIEMTKFLKANQMLHKPRIVEPYPTTKAYEKIKNMVETDIEQFILQINESFVNFTKWTDIELLGIVELMSFGDIERLEKLS